MKSLKEYLLHYFTPQPTNNYRAKTLHIDFLSFYMVAALLFALTYKNIGPYFHNVLGFATDISVPKLFELTNKERATHSLGSLTYNPLLEAAAREKAADMFAKNYWSHFGPDGTSPWNFILKSGYQYEFAGENLAKNFLYSQGVVDAWMASPTHRENVLNGNYTEVGYAIVNGTLNGEETTLVVQMFGKPLHTAVASAPPPETAPQEVSAPETLPAKQVQTAPVENSPAVLGQDLNKPKINLLFITLDGTYIFIFFFSLILLADFYIASRLNVVRVGGKHIAHLIFIGFIAIFVLVIMKRGAIL
jgi:hypothetical protein